jgi:hypothetical protein
MTSNTTGRGIVNELTTLIERINQPAMKSIGEEFPQFTDEIYRGPDAGKAETDSNYYEDRARLASKLCTELVPSIYEIANRVVDRAASLSSTRLFVGIIAGIGGAATLASFGVGKDNITQISGIVTSIVAILNAALDNVAKRYTSTETEKAVMLKKAALELSQLRQELDLKVFHKRSFAEIIETIDKCNHIAFDLNQRKEQLRLV